MRVFFLLFSLVLVSCAGLQPRYHEIVPGESLSKIATHYHVSIAALKRYNSQIETQGARVGTKLYIPFETRSDWDKPIANTDGALGGAEVALSRNPDAAMSPEKPHFRWPLLARISSYFGIRHHKRHEGIDIAAPSGTPVRAARSGHIIYAGSRIRGYGNMVIIKHADSYSTVYAHLSRFAAHMKKGIFVAAGQLIGLVGHTGHAFGSHLHFEVRDPGRKPEDPLFFLQERYARNTLGR